MSRPHPTTPSPAIASERLVLFLHGAPADEADGWAAQPALAGHRRFSRHPVEGVERCRAAVSGLGALCTEVAEQAPGCALLLLRHPLAPSEAALAALAELADRAPGIGVYSAFSNADARLNPFAGLPEPGGDAELRERLVDLLGSGRLLPLDRWPDALLLLTADAVRAVADPALDWRDAQGRLRSRLVQAELADWIWVEAPGRPLAAEPRLEPHEERRPVPWGELSARLQDWLPLLPALDAGRLPRPGDAPVTLHVTHSWGGGVATWVRAFIDGDPGGLHLQLRSEGPQTGQGAGQRLSLYLGNELRAPLARWWLQPPIRAVDSAHAQYREVLDQVCRRFGVGRVIVSSLVGHCLDALRTERPTVQVLHDAFPAWPLLSIHPEEYDGDLAAALGDPRAEDQFPGQSLEDWRRIGENFAEAARGALRVAPSAAARNIQARVEPGLDVATVEVVPHGLPPLPRQTVQPRARPDGRLRVLVPGRVQSGKGAELLERALPELLRHAQLTLLGTGKGGERFFGHGGVNVVLQYERGELASLLAGIGPHLALLPSTVPETFSYTLSEMRALGVPVVATRVGSFAERITHGVDGWLVDPDPAALVAEIAARAADPESLAAVRRRLAGDAPRTIAAMVADYAALCPARREAPIRPTRHGARLDLAEAQAAAASDQLRRDRTRLAAAADEARQLRSEVEARTRWATGLEAAVREARTERDRVMAVSAEQDEELGRRAAHIEALDRQLEDRVRQLEDRDRQLEDRDRQLEHRAREQAALQDTLDRVLASRSWKLTRPLRGGRRLLAGLVRLRAWNPARWPLLASQGARTLATTGVEGTLRRIQRVETESLPPPGEHAADATTVPAEAALPAAIPASDTPRVSIVIPAYNHLEHTTACLASLATARCDTPFEVIVVDDASADATPERMPEVDGLRFLRNPQNLGFIGSCNRGAAEARGEFVLFLNNDTQVRDGWLDALLDTFDSWPDAGLVGARLVYPDGRLQECGGLVFSDGSGWNLGRGDEPDRPEYQVLREVDYCSGACIVLRRDLFDTLGGFDAHYAPAYYEDTDLAFRVRAEGLRVYVQPRATVVHFEGVTSGTDLASGTKRYQALNRRKFLTRWKDTLADQPAPIRDPEDRAAVRAARDHRLRGRVLVVDAYTPEPDQDSGSVRLVNFMRCLQDLGYGVTFLPDNRRWSGDYTRALQADGIEAWYDPWLRSPEAFLRERGRDFDLVVVSRHYVACNYLGPVRRHAPQARFLFDTVDLHYLREQRLAALEDSTTLRRVAQQTRRSELAVVRDADATLVVSPVERDLLAEEAPGARVFVLSNIHEVGGPGGAFDERSDLYFVGGYQHPPNIDAAHWFVEEIWPLVRERLPGVRFHLVGSKAPDDVRALGAHDGVEFHGFVPDLDPFLDRCRLSVAPLRYGAGVKGKVNQAMAHGQPVVATPAAVEGIHASDGEDVLVAEDAEAFADAVVRLYGDESLWRRLSENGLRNVEQHFSRAAARRAIESLLEELAD